MTKKKKKDDQDQVVAELTQEKELLIVEGKIKDDFCNFKYQINTGSNKNDTHGVTGRNTIHDDMRDAFQKFRPHFAALCDAFERSGFSGSSFEEYANHQLVDLYHVTGFKIKGAGEAESISLIGSYHSMTSQGRIEASTNFVSLDLGDYRWYNELREAAEEARHEVELYMQGKCIPPEEEQPTDKKQLTILDTAEEEKE